MKLAHAFHDRLAGFEIGLDTEGRIFCSKALQANRHLFLVSLGFRLNRDLDHRIREGHGFQNDRLVRITDRVTRGRFLQAGKRNNVTCIGFGDLVLLVGVHHDHTADALLLALGRVHEAVALGQRTGIDTREGQRAHVRVVHDLEGKTREWLRIICAALDIADFVFVARGKAHIGRHVERPRQIIDDSVQHWLHAFVLERRTRHDRHERHGQRALADQ